MVVPRGLQVAVFVDTLGEGREVIRLATAKINGLADVAVSVVGVQNTVDSGGHGLIFMLKRRFVRKLLIGIW
jgi:hypothetical protein